MTCLSSSTVIKNDTCSIEQEARVDPDMAATMLTSQFSISLAAGCSMTVCMPSHLLSNPPRAHSFRRGGYWMSSLEPVDPVLLARPSCSRGAHASDRPTDQRLPKLACGEVCFQLPARPPALTITVDE